MTAAEQQYFALLRTALWNEPVVLEGEIEWDAVMRIAKHHGNDVLIGDAASRMIGDNKPSAEILASMKESLRGNLFHQLRLKQILVSAIQLLRQHNIEPVLLKGFGLALLYPNPNLRQFGDIDIFVGLDDFHQACTLLRSLPGGYNWGEEIDVGRHYNIEFGPYPMEVHRISADVVDADEHEIYSAIERDGLVEHSQRVSLDGFEISVPSKEFVVFFTFYHAWHHFMTSGVGWRQISDVAMTLHSYMGQSVASSGAIDVEKLRSWLEAMHVMRPWQTFGWLMVEYLGLPKVEMPFYDASCRRRALKLYERIMAEGNFRRPNRFKRRKPKRSMMKKMHSFVSIFVDYFQLASVFPDQARHEMHTALKLGLRKNFKKN